MRKSAAVTLILSGSLLTGCDPNRNGIAPHNADSANDAPYTNNTYHAGYGYWHAPYRAWYPYPYNYYSPGLGYYHGGGWSSAPEESSVAASSSLVRGAGERITGARSSSSITRGGFGSIGRGAAS
ncbi:MAG TPA: hypothetical protein VFC44_25655 [Candidatus Saccharimonadales bacterium]|nr:hypothetical protein [Candidatus Saccharimonadales bacterium]